VILGQFPWRGIEVEADQSVTSLAGEVVWLKRVDTGTGLGMVRDGRLIMSANAPKDSLAWIELRDAFEQFRESITGAPA
jgi:hypothetical protein